MSNLFNNEPKPSVAGNEARPATIGNGDVPEADPNPYAPRKTRPRKNPEEEREDE
jgi:hypothetical protein